MGKNLGFQINKCDWITSFFHCQFHSVQCVQFDLLNLVESHWTSERNTKCWNFWNFFSFRFFRLLKYFCVSCFEPSKYWLATLQSLSLQKWKLFVYSYSTYARISPISTQESKKKQAENIVNATIMKFRRYQSRNKWWNHILRPKYLLLISARISSQKKLLYNITSTSHESLLKWLLLLLLCRLLVSLQTTEPTMRKNENMVRWEFYAF